MPKWYTARRGDHLARIAYRNGLPGNVIWDHPNNRNLKATRDPDVLLAGDEVYIPSVELRQVSAAAGRAHAFRAALPPIVFSVRLLRSNQPVARMPYALEVDGSPPRTGRTDEQGWLKEPVPPFAERAKLVLAEGEIYLVAFGELDPAHTVSGVQARLRTLGYYEERISGTWNAAAIAALKAFQTENGLRPTGEADEPTRRLLKQLAGA